MPSRKEIRQRMNWNTGMEIEFLKGMGLCKYRRARPDCSRHDLLVRYLKAAKVRKNWGEIQKDLVLDHARSMIEKLSKSTER